MENKQLAQYLNDFTSLRRDAKNGGAPHKPILLLSLIQAFENGFITDKRIYILPELIGFFKSNWQFFVQTDHDARFALPFYHMTTEPFWRLIPKEGCEIWVQSKGAMRSLSNLQTAVKYAEIDDSLTNFLKDATSRDVLRMAILEKYFPNIPPQYSSDLGLGFVNDIRNQILEESPTEYVTEIRKLKTRLSKEAFEEEVVMRGGIFKREVPRNYGYTCCISGLRIDATFNSSTLIEACHIKPFSVSFDDTLSNGITLTPTLHTAFDNGFFTLSEKFEVIISKNLTETSSPQGIMQYHGRKILLPNSINCYPNLESIRWHQENKFEK